MLNKTFTLFMLLMFCVTLSAKGASVPKDADDWPFPERWLPVDEQGWTVVEPVADSRIIYVSSSEGNDETGKVYSPGDAVSGDDPRHPKGTVRAYKTLGAALAQARAKMPDWVLLKRGDVWREEDLRIREGRSQEEPFVVCAYGEGERPMFKGRNGKVLIADHRRGPRHVVLMDLVLYCSFLDPESEDYGVPTAEKIARNMAPMGLRVYGGSEEPGRNVLIENCNLRFCMLFVSHAMENLVIRRCVVVDEYPPRGHTMGMWGTGASVLLEECFFDHNGWLLQRNEANKGKPGLAIPLSHNTYTSNMFKTIFRNTIFCRSASIHNKFTANDGKGSSRHIIVDNNLYVDGEIGISMGGNNPAPLRWVDCHATNNVMLDLGLSQPTGRNLGWGIGSHDWDGGIIAGNLVIHQRSENISNVWAVKVGASESGGPQTINVRNLTIRGNLFHGLRSRSSVLNLNITDKMRNISIMNNQIQMSGLDTPLLHVEGNSLAALRFENNTWFTDAEADRRFRINKEPLSFEDWSKNPITSGEKFEKIDYPDDTRNIQNYMRHLDREPTHAAFIEIIRSQSKLNWRKEFTAKVINDWMREGFALQPYQEVGNF